MAKHNHFFSTLAEDGCPFGMLFGEAASKYGMLVIGIYRYPNHCVWLSFFASFPRIEVGNLLAAAGRTHKVFHARGVAPPWRKLTL